MSVLLVVLGVELLEASGALVVLVDVPELLLDVLALSLVGVTSPPLSLRTGMRWSECSRDDPLALPPLLVPLLFGDRLTSPPELFTVPRSELVLLALGQLESALPLLPLLPVLLLLLTPPVEPYELVFAVAFPDADDVAPVMLIEPVVPEFARPPARRVVPVPVAPPVPVVPVVLMLPVVPLVPVVPFVPLIPLVLVPLLTPLVPLVPLVPLMFMPFMLLPDMPFALVPTQPVAHGDRPLALLMLPFELVPVVCAAALPAMMALSEMAIPIT